MATTQQEFELYNLIKYYQTVTAMNILQVVIFLLELKELLHELTIMPYL